MDRRVEWWDRAGAHHVERASGMAEVKRCLNRVRREGGTISKVNRIPKVD